MPLKSLRNSFRRKNKLATSDSWIKDRNNNENSENNDKKNNELNRKGIMIKSSSGSLVGDKAALWTKKVENHQAGQASNPFSDSYAGPQKLNKLDPNYGRPRENSLTAQRARDGEAKVRQEICDLCRTVFDFGKRTEDGRSSITFGKLFQIYIAINDKCVGLCLMARKRNLLSFDGEMLFQRRDDDKVIKLVKSMNSINVYFGREGDVPGGGEVDPEVIERRRCDSLASISVTESPAQITVIPETVEDSSGRRTAKPRSLANSFRRMTRPFVEKRKSFRRRDDNRKNIEDRKKNESVEKKDAERDKKGSAAAKRWNRVLGVTVALGRLKKGSSSDEEGPHPK